MNDKKKKRSVSRKSECAGSIKIVLEITDEDTLLAYGYIHKSFIEDDLRYGTLMKMCDVVSIESNAR